MSLIRGLAVYLIIMALAEPAFAASFACVVRATASNVDLDSSPVGEATRSIAIVATDAGTAARECARNHAGIARLAALDACAAIVDAKFVSIVFQLDGAALKSKYSKVKIRDQRPERDVARLKLRSCAYWTSQ